MHLFSKNSKMKYEKYSKISCLQMKFCWIRIVEKSEGCIKQTIHSRCRPSSYMSNRLTPQAQPSGQLLLSDEYIHQTQITAKSIRRKYLSNAVKGLIELLFCIFSPRSVQSLLLHFLTNISTPFTDVWNNIINSSYCSLILCLKHCILGCVSWIHRTNTYQKKLNTKIIQNTKFTYILYAKTVQIKILYDNECTRNLHRIPKFKLKWLKMFFLHTQNVKTIRNVCK